MNTSIKKVKELLSVLDPYAEFWHEWKVSGACFLTEQEIIIIQNYLITGSHFTSANQLSISPVTAASILNKSILRLRWSYPVFQSWITEQLLEAHGIIVYETERERFLHSPFAYLPMPLPLKRKLNMLNPETMSELLIKHSEADLKRCRCIGDKTISELKIYLIKNHCLYLLK